VGYAKASYKEKRQGKFQRNYADIQKPNQILEYQLSVE